MDPFGLHKGSDSNGHPNVEEVIGTGELFN